MKMRRSRPFSAFLNKIPGFTHLAGHVAFNRVRTALSKPTGLYFLFSIPSGTPVGVRPAFHKSLEKIYLCVTFFAELLRKVLKCDKLVKNREMERRRDAS